MKLRLRPLRGQTYETDHMGWITFIEHVNSECVKVLKDGAMSAIPLEDLILPIIDTKDYEKIEDTKYKGD